ncbi:hypothetical protein MXB_920, partial [Myxobolus squamalis]
MKNHEYVPDLLVFVISNLKKRIVIQILHDLVKLSMAQFVKNKNQNGYRLTFSGYDALSIHALVGMGVIAEIGSKVGVGKESDIYIGLDHQRQRIILKFHRLGRNSFRRIKEKRDYLENRTHTSWLYSSRLAATKEFKFMTVLKENGFPVPQPLGHNRHCVFEFRNHVASFDDPSVQFDACRNLIIGLAESGLIHCDFNEFNLITDPEANIFMIDFPQLVSIDHPNADWYFQRDLNCLKSYFEKRYHFSVDDNLKLSDIQRKKHLDIEVSASGAKKHQSDLLSSDEEEKQFDLVIDDPSLEESVDKEIVYIGDSIDQMVLNDQRECGEMENLNQIPPPKL